MPGIETTPEQRHLSAARSRDLWRHPDRLHVTVQYFGKDVSRQEAEQLVGKSFPVKAAERAAG
ncbi:unnamed protein product [Effrenium voratum]|uniref:Uncharacterized protein n=1 Tax=Effrenium voratum TaxID=2562239 RepID=A0AA36HMG4_9DINO|nr:unnamed protein product [Effrenium voratum]CAJ1427758.1 unnamed protein product [Effrenium voratum]